MNLTRRLFLRSGLAAAGGWLATPSTPAAATRSPEDPYTAVSSGDADLHQRLLTYVSDAVAGFVKDIERIGRADDVAMLIFSEFGRRVPENTSLGTDHGTANHMYLVGKQVNGGHYGKAPSLAVLDEGDNLVFTSDFRRVYATVIEGWLQSPSDKVLRGRFDPFPVFA